MKRKFKVIFFLLSVSLVLFFVFSYINNRGKAGIKAKMERSVKNSSSNSDVDIKITNFGKMYGALWNLKNDEEPLKRQLGEKAYEELLRKSISIEAPFAASKLGKASIDIRKVEENARFIDATLKKCNITPASYFAIVETDIERMGIKAPVVFAVLGNEKIATSMVVGIPGLSDL